MSTTRRRRATLPAARKTAPWPTLRGQFTQQLRVGDWAELHCALFENSFNATLRRFRSNYAFRGLADSTWGLDTSLQRLGGSYWELEKSMLRNFKKYAHGNHDYGEAEWKWLSLAQHHGLPTRLIDWTYSPYVALHFATDDMRLMDKDAVIWCIDCDRALRYLPPLFLDIRQRFNAFSFSVDMMDAAATSLEALENLKNDDFVVFFEPRPWMSGS